MKQLRLASPLIFAIASTLACAAQAVRFDHPEPADLPLAHAVILVESSAPETVRTAANAFAGDIEAVTGSRPRVVATLPSPAPETLVVVGVAGQSPTLDRLQSAGKLDKTAIANKWEAAVTTIVESPMPGVKHALVIAGSDRRGAAFALFTLSRQMGVSPWSWWADVPVPHHAEVYIHTGTTVQNSPSVPYRGIFLNDEDWGLRPWAAKKMDPELKNVGPHAYERIFELLLRLHANSLWPAMHPGTLAFNAVPENAKLADKWGIVMGSSHSEALLRNNVGEWDEKRDGPWNYQTNHSAIDKYWDKRLAENGRFENFYTVGMRGVHDSGLEATGSAEVKARLVEDVMKEQRRILAAHVTPDVTKVPQVIWLYKESLELYRAGMKVPDDVTLGWTDDNYGYIRQLPTVAEQQRSGGSGIYYHVSYWGFPHDHLWLSSTPPALIREEMTKAYDHNARRYWVLNVGDLKPAEADIDYFMQLAWDEPRMAAVDQSTFLRTWLAEQFPTADASRIANLMQRYYQLNFVRKPEFMGFNGYNDGINRTDFNPLAWGDQNHERLAAWQTLASDTAAVAKTIPASAQDAFFELVGYPVAASEAQNEKFLAADRSFLFAAEHSDIAREEEAFEARAAYNRIQTLTAQYNSLQGGKWDGIMSAAPRQRHVFEMPQTASAADATKPLPAMWAPDLPSAKTATPGSGFVEKNGLVSIEAAHFSKKQDGSLGRWNILADLGISGDSVVYGAPGKLANSMAAPPALATEPWLEYEFTTGTQAPATLALFLLPTFPVDAQHHLGYGVSIDGGAPKLIDASGSGEWKENSAPVWAANVLRNAAIGLTPLGPLAPGKHTLRLYYRDPGVVFEHLVIAFPNAVPAYPVPPETR
ncbi:Glycosyl hydrolase family 115 [Granulicella rosea]|uniref:Glycosyl hydrolase family 115 n=1 Tax=Granulicella rosea TaxID=474952 RepID=A0A239LX34_9BACT|nr:glycosyl hydrolase 115 family protein [Granulicella rosea]SNT35086.1 Glycosyl hydrolase family 115 [Granulicella rosea]